MPFLGCYMIMFDIGIQWNEEVIVPEREKETNWRKDRIFVIDRTPMTQWLPITSWIFYK